MFFEDDCLSDKLFDKHFFACYYAIRKNAQSLKIYLPWIIADCGRYARFLEFGITSPQDFIDFVNFHKPQEKQHKEKFFQLVLNIGRHLEQWKDSDEEYQSVIHLMQGEEEDKEEPACKKIRKVPAEKKQPK